VWLTGLVFFFYDQLISLEVIDRREREREREREEYRQGWIQLYVDGMFSMSEALGSIPSTTGGKR
jgi:hypothetical protein